MDFEINSENLYDSPYKASKDSLFSFNEEGLHDLADDLCQGNQTCYLISGYRGVGKTSFINKLETCAVERAKKNESIFFINVSFAKYNSQSFLIRKLLRQLFIKIKANSKSGDHFETSDGKKIWQLLEALHKQTFYYVKEYIAAETVRTRSFTIGLNYQFITDAVNTVMPALILGSLFSGLNLLFPNLVILFSFIWLVSAIINISAYYTQSKTNERKISSESLYDEEIAGYHFLDILRKLSTLKIRVVFVLDELDKVDDSEARLLINEMKPFLVSGEASFIVVSGQKLFYKFYEDRLKDDSILSSLFSRIIHVSLANPADLRKFFFDHLLINHKLTVLEKEVLDNFVDRLIFDSRLVHRRFISLIRQHSVWRNKKCYVTMPSPLNPIIYRKILEIISNVQSNYIEADGLDKGMKDYLIMDLYIHCHKKLRDHYNTKFLIPPTSDGL